MGNPISISGKSIFYDRKTLSKKALSENKKSDDPVLEQE